jgi:allophanate hydrolase
MATTLAELRDAYRAGASPVDVVKETYDRFDACGDPAIVITSVPRDESVARARALEGRDPDELPLFGVPFAVKDNIDVAGVATTAGCPSYATVPATHAVVVERLCAAGAIPVVKTNLDQFATGLVGTRSPYGTPRNALDPAYVPGGSSSGSAVSVARGLVPFALGTDTAGSGRVPAAFNAVVGLKPSRGRLSTRGVVPAVRSVDCVAMFAHTVADAWSVFAVTAGYDPQEPYSRRPPATVAPAVRRLGVLADARADAHLDTDAATAYTAALDALDALGYELEPIDETPFLAAGDLLYGGPWIAERYLTFGSFLESHPDDPGVDPTVAKLILGGGDVHGADAYAGAHELARLRRETEATWARVDALAFPTTPTIPTLADVAADPLGANSQLGALTAFVNLLDLCALAVPGPARGDGLPAGVSLIAPAGHDEALAVAGARLLGETPPVATAATIELAVVGAHLRGQPLHHQLVDLGARFVRTARTSADYRLYALPATSPPKPGLVRSADRGAPVAVEVYAFTPEALGRFVADVAAPLTIGTITLEDGTEVHGFVCEQHAVAGATDITAHGGWAAYIESR